MMDDDLKALQERVRFELGRDMSLEDVARNRGRLGPVLAFAKRIAGWEGRLDLTEPAHVSMLIGRRTT